MLLTRVSQVVGDTCISKKLYWSFPLALQSYHVLTTMSQFMYLRHQCDFFNHLHKSIGVDHCVESNHGCEQLCLNTGDSYVCQCSEGFVINEDLKTCSRKSCKNILHFRSLGKGFSFHTGKRTCLQFILTVCISVIL